MMDDDECGTISGLIGIETEVLGGNLPHYDVVHHKCHMT
jgi:hypothetical protein